MESNNSFYSAGDTLILFNILIKMEYEAVVCRCRLKKGPSLISFPVSFCLLVRKMIIFMVACFGWLSGDPAVEHQSEFRPHFLCSPVSLVHLDGKKSLELLKCGMSSEQFCASIFLPDSDSSPGAG